MKLFRSSDTGQNRPTFFKKTAASPSQWGVRAIFACVFLVMLVANALTPLISDDYSYLMRNPTFEPIKTFWDIVVSQYNHYMLWGGRTVAIGLTQIFLWLGKWVFNVFNSAAFCLTVWAGAKLAVGRKALTPLAVLPVLGLLVHFNPCFGAVNLWLTGSCVYLWPLMLGLCFLLPYRFYLDGAFAFGRSASIAMFFLGLAAGWGNENNSPVTLLAALCFVVLNRVFSQNKKTPVWAISGIAGCFAGILLLLLSPGQWVRNSTVAADSRSTLTVLLVRFMNATDALKTNCLVLIGLLFALYLVLGLTTPGAKALTLPVVYFVLAMAANYALVLSPVYYIRSLYPVVTFLVLAIASCLSALCASEPRKGSAFSMALAGVLCALLLFDGLEGGYDIVSYRTMRTVREGEIMAEINAGNTEIETYAIYPYTRFCGAYGIPDLRTDKLNWVNVNMAHHLGAEYLVVTEQHYYPFPGYDDFSNTVDTQLSYELE